MRGNLKHTSWRRRLPASLDSVPYRARGWSNGSVVVVVWCGRGVNEDHPEKKTVWPASSHCVIKDTLCNSVLSFFFTRQVVNEAEGRTVTAAGAAGSSWEAPVSSDPSERGQRRIYPHKEQRCGVSVAWRTAPWNQHATWARRKRSSCWKLQSRATENASRWDLESAPLWSAIFVEQNLAFNHWKKIIQRCKHRPIRTFVLRLFCSPGFVPAPVKRTYFRWSRKLFLIRCGLVWTAVFWGSVWVVPQFCSGCLVCICKCCEISFADRIDLRPLGLCFVHIRGLHETATFLDELFVLTYPEV